MAVGTNNLSGRPRPLLPPPPTPPRSLKPVKATKPSVISAAMNGKRPTPK
jgi:hypothetical protein